MADRRGVEFRQGYVLPTLEPGEVPAWMASLSPLAREAARADLRFHAEQGLSLRPFLPHWEARPHHDRAKVIALRDALARAYQAALNRSHDLARLAPQSVDVSSALDLGKALALAIFAAAETGRSEAQDRLKICVFLGELPEIADDVAQVVRRSRSAGVSVFDAGTERALVLVELSDDAEAGATLDGLRAGRGDDLTVLARVETPGGAVWLPDGVTVPPERRGLVADMLAAMEPLEILSTGDSLAVFGRPDTELLFAPVPAELAGVGGEELAADGFAPTTLSVTPVRPAPSETALRALQERIVESRFPVGYRVGLHPLSERVGSEEDIEILREEIAEREAEIELIRALAAPQKRLLRFTDAQLPALADGMRRIPPETLRRSRLLYAAGHAAGRAEPAHFILYDPGQVALEGLLPERYWRGETEDRPIRYWLDPHAAQAMERSGVRTLVFTPARHRLLPAIDSFGGDLDQTLRLILGNLFADASAVLEAEGAEPLFVFSPPSLSGADMDVELLDRRWFRPLHLSLRWLNDYMVVRAPRVADRQVLSRLAEDLYEGEVAETLRRDAQASAEALREAWSEAERELQAQIDDVLSHVADEIRRSTERLKFGRTYLQDAQGRIAQLDELIEKMSAQVSAAASASDAMGQLAPALGEERFHMVADLLSEIELGDQAMLDAERRVQTQVREIERLVERLRRL